MKTVAFFNNKGGVGKTTLTCNLAAQFATKLRKRVLVIDCDPQCNSTQLILNPETLDALYSNEAKPTRTVLDVVRPIEVGVAEINVGVLPHPASDNRFKVDILPGHPRMSVVEDKLSQNWTQVSGGDIGGLRVTNWCAVYCRHIGAQYDVAFLDLGPSLGSLNRTVLLGSDFFVTPMGGDIFSIAGVRNIALWLNDWITLYLNGIQQCDARHPGAVDEFRIRRDVPIATGFAGYTIQQYITKAIRGKRRPTLAFERILERVPTEVRNSLQNYYHRGVDDNTVKLGDVPNLFSLIPLAQNANAPLINLTARDGLVGAQFQQAKEYAAILDHVARSLAVNIGLETL